MAAREGDEMATPPHRLLALGLLAACCAVAPAAGPRPAGRGQADPARLRQADQLLGEVQRLLRRGKYAAARKPAEQALAIRRELLGAADPATARAMTALGAVHKQR